MNRAASNPASVHIGILDAVPAEFYLPGEKTDPAKFIDMFTAIGAPFRFETYRATEGNFPASLDDCDAYLITGSPCSVYDTYSWIKDMENFIHHVYADGTPLVGICFGHQLIAQSLGGKVRLADDGWLLGLHDLRVRSPRPWMHDGASTHPLYFINQDQVVNAPPGVEHLAGTELCPNAMFGVTRRLLTLQAHPEQPHSSMRAFIELLVDRYGLDPDRASAALDSMAAREPDANRVATWISNFLVDACRPEADVAQ